jgi:hypothetical protein
MPKRWRRFAGFRILAFKTLRMSEPPMKPHPRQEEQDDLLRPRLTDMIDMRHELVKLAALIDWEFFAREWAGFFPSHVNRHAKVTHLVGYDHLKLTHLHC